MRTIVCMGCGQALWRLRGEQRFVSVADPALETLPGVGIPPPRTGQLFCPVCGSYKLVAQKPIEAEVIRD